MLIHGTTAPRFTENPEYKVTSNSYTEDEGELTKQGALMMEEFGKQLRKEFINENPLLPNDYKPENFYHKVYRGNSKLFLSYDNDHFAYRKLVKFEN